MCTFRKLTFSENLFIHCFNNTIWFEANEFAVKIFPYEKCAVCHPSATSDNVRFRTWSSSRRTWHMVKAKYCVVRSVYVIKYEHVRRLLRSTVRVAGRELNVLLNLASTLLCHVWPRKQINSHSSQDIVLIWGASYLFEAAFILFNTTLFWPSCLAYHEFFTSIGRQCKSAHWAYPIPLCRPYSPLCQRQILKDLYSCSYSGLH